MCFHIVYYDLVRKKRRNSSNESRRMGREFVVGAIDSLWLRTHLEREKFCVKYMQIQLVSGRT